MKTERIRDPIHGLIVFDGTGLVDEQVWALLKTPDVQRLRRIKQLGVSELVFPSASHSRFAHSIGVFHNARRLIQIVQREIDLKRVDGKFDEYRAKVALFAALLHDIGHGPFSHAFEEARKALAVERAGGSLKTQIRKHEAFTAEMIEDESGQIGAILAEAGIPAKEVASLVAAETPTDMYHAVVSSSFDADRLDYLARDRYMTGTGAGAIDLDWLMDNVRVAQIDVSAPDAGDEPIYEHSFCLGYKARDAAEDFLLARYRLYTNVYFHKTTRGIEQMVSAFFRLIARESAAGGSVWSLPDDHALVQFFASGGDTIANYRALDDTVVWGALHAVARGGDNIASQIAGRILKREKPVCLDIQHAFPEDTERQRRLKHTLDQKFKDQIGETVFRDSAKLSIYGEIGADDGRAQKRLMIQMSNGDPREITTFRDATIAESGRERPFERYYFLSEQDYRIALAACESVQGRRT
jgi:HD superfamily phosphohydrolase